LREGGEQLKAALAVAAGDALAHARALLSMARLCFWQGDYPAARELCDRALRLYRERADDRGQAWVLTLLGSIHAYEGDYDRGRRRLEEVLDLVDDEDIRMEALVGLGEVLIQMGEMAQARARLDEVIALARGPEAPRGRAALFLGLVDFFDTNYAGARRNVARSLGIFQRLGNRYALAAALDVSAGLALADSEPLDALRLSGAAAALRELVRAPLAPRWQEILQAVVIRPASDAAGDRAAAAWAEGQQMPVEAAVSCALEALHAEPAASEAASAASTGLLAGLSMREVEVAELVAQGMTNRQVAERLGVAERTAEGHVERIRRKLGVRTRTQIAIAVLKG
jgi:non-specific serine/threonine protein kinase